MNKSLKIRLQQVTSGLKLKATAGALAVMGMSTSVMAGTTGTEFEGFYDLMVSWTSGYLGKGIALAAFLLGAALGMVKGTMIPALVGIGFAIMFSVGPGVITGMLAATV
jgi:conjugal transfer pilus assembly protein TraA